MLSLTLLAVLCRHEDYGELDFWAGERADWLGGFLDLPVRNGRPHKPHADTFERVFSHIDPVAMERCFVAFTHGIAEASAGWLISIDRKTPWARWTSVAAPGSKTASHLVQATYGWDQNDHLVLEQLAMRYSASGGQKRQNYGGAPAVGTAGCHWCGGQI